MENQQQHTPTQREMLAQMLGNVHPESDFSDEDTLFQQIINDYEAYADMINRENQREQLTEQKVAKAYEEGRIAGRNERIEIEMSTPHDTDGVPALGGANNSATPSRGSSIFDTALGAYLY